MLVERMVEQYCSDRILEEEILNILPESNTYIGTEKP